MNNLNYEGTKYEKYIVGSPKWNELNKNKKKSKSRYSSSPSHRKLMDKISQKEFSKNYSELDGLDKYFVDDAYWTNPDAMNTKNYF